ncbi:uncharacterized protein B0H18DRAFT_1010344 [Fomitopsis serialis]|uniref:uncharacterized protein n=1 Tax=Fomitopsis serialis TaxID=139415 RepID=UPI0020081FBA|nr:uncharacterized protein B0H18DRAFT_1010344 [Neoantrodia serialis]KAH9924838.1 hypothetical protein B0H18DRAFT_1010344 [Neoantrodia serialis]
MLSMLAISIYLCLDQPSLQTTSGGLFAASPRQSAPGLLRQRKGPARAQRAGWTPRGNAIGEGSDYPNTDSSPVIALSSYYLLSIFCTTSAHSPHSVNNRVRTATIFHSSM